MNLQQEALGTERIHGVARRFERNQKTLLKEKRILFVVDISNLYFCVQKHFGSKINYEKLLKFVTGSNNNFVALAYGTERNGGAENFKKVLERFGYQVYFKEVREVTNGQLKGNIDVEITIAITNMIDDFDILVLGSADGDFAPCLDLAKSKGKECHVIGCQISQSLRAAADSYREIEEWMLE